MDIRYNGLNNATLVLTAEGSYFSLKPLNADQSSPPPKKPRLAKGHQSLFLGKRGSILAKLKREADANAAADLTTHARYQPHGCLARTGKQARV